MDEGCTIIGERIALASMSIPELRAYANGLEATANMEPLKEKRRPLYVEAARVRVYADTKYSDANPLRPI